VNAGLAASFQQCLSCITLPPAAPAAPQTSSSQSPAAAGSLAMLGHITKKLVITPSLSDSMASLRPQQQGRGAKQSDSSHVGLEEEEGEEMRQVDDI
jgi:hypothetical protein